MNSFLKAAIEQAELGLDNGGIPIGCVIVKNSKIVARGHNQRIQKSSVVLHAEMDAFENLGRQDANFYSNCELYTTLSPCSMCSGAVLLYGIPRVFVGEEINFKGDASFLRSRGVEVNVFQDDKCILLMKNFINNNPNLWHEDIGV